MTAIDLQRRAVWNVGRSFYLTMSLLMAAVIVGGFSTTVPDDFAAHPGLPLLLHIHGAVFTLWVLVFVAQPAFISQGAVKLHRRIGLAGAVLAGAMVIMGLAATLYAVRFHRVPSFFPAGVFLVMNSLGILVFGGLVAAGVVLRHRAEWHKRLMLCATISILGPGLGRLLPMGSFGALAPLVMFAASSAFAFAGPVLDLVKFRRVHRAYVWGVGAILVSEAAIMPLAFAPPTTALIRLIRS